MTNPTDDDFVHGPLSAVPDTESLLGAADAPEDTDGALLARLSNDPIALLAILATENPSIITDHRFPLEVGDDSVDIETRGGKRFRLSIREVNPLSVA